MKQKRKYQIVVSLREEERAKLYEIMRSFGLKTTGGAVRQLIILYKKFQQFIS